MVSHLTWQYFSDMKRVYLLFILPLLFYSCGTTLITVPNPEVDIYVNNVYKGKGTAEIPRMGPPQKASLSAKYHGAEVGSMVIKRKLDLTGCLVGYFTYGVGLFFSFRYPSEVTIPIRSDLYQNGNPVRSRWDEPPGNSRW